MHAKRLDGVWDMAQCGQFYTTCIARPAYSSAKAQSLHPIKDWPKKDNFPSTEEIGKRIADASKKLASQFKAKADLVNDEHLEKTANMLRGFYWGASSSEHQFSPNCTPEVCSYARYAQQNNFERIENITQLNLWKNYAQYLSYLKHTMGLNTFRFSVEWALVQPEGPDSFDENALNHYADMFTYAIKQGIAPLVCFHHYTDPCWFIDAGGFETEENIHSFSEFCATVYERMIERAAKDPAALAQLQKMSPRIPLWATFNSPEGYAFKGYGVGGLPPNDSNKKGTLWAQQVLKNLCEAHVKVYQALNEKHEELLKNYPVLKNVMPKPCIGFLKNIHQLDPCISKSVGAKLMTPITKLVCKLGNMIQNDFIFNFFTKGLYNAPTINHKNPDAPHSLDFIGINYYSNRFMCGAKKVASSALKDGSATANKNYRVYPEGIYRAIVEVYERLAKPLSIPMVWTEGGIATDDNEQRTQFYQSYLYALCRALEDGYPICGYLPWALADNYEWHAKQNDRRVYGLCSVADDGETLTIKPGAQSYLSIVQAFSKN